MSQSSEPDRAARPETEEEARQRRLAALRELAGTSSQLAAVHPEQSAHAAPTTRRSRRPWWLAAGTLVLAAVVIATLYLTGTFAPTQSHGRTTTPNTAVEIAPGMDDLLCPQDIAWSPDGTRVAVLGYLQTCFDAHARYSSAAGPLGMLIIYDARTGSRLQRIPLDQAIASAFPFDQSIVNAFKVAGAPPPFLLTSYVRVLWLPDGQHVAVEFQTFQATAAQPKQGQFDYTGNTINGVWLGDQQGSNARLITHVDGNASFTSTGEQLAAVPGWDLTAGAVHSVVPASSGGLLPLALSYAWQSDGSIAPQQPFTDATVPQAVPAGPIGVPGDASFTFWQPSQVNVLVLAPLGHPQPPFAYIFTANFSALSPGGHYLSTPLVAQGLLEPNGQPPNPQLVTNDNLGSLPRVPLRDAALQAVTNMLTRAASDGLDHGVTLAWSPDGRLLAAQVAPAHPTVSADQYPVSVYDTRSGQLLATLTPLAAGGSTGLGGQRVTTVLRWSADGSHLLMENTILGTFTIWGPGQLPHLG